MPIKIALPPEYSIKQKFVFRRHFSGIFRVFSISCCRGEFGCGGWELFWSSFGVWGGLFSVAHHDRFSTLVFKATALGITPRYDVGQQNLRLKVFRERVASLIRVMDASRHVGDFRVLHQSSMQPFEAV